MELTYSFSVLVQLSAPSTSSAAVAAKLLTVHTPVHLDLSPKWTVVMDLQAAVLQMHCHIAVYGEKKKKHHCNQASLVHLLHNSTSTISHARGFFTSFHEAMNTAWRDCLPQGFLFTETPGPAISCPQHQTPAHTYGSVRPAVIHQHCEDQFAAGREDYLPCPVFAFTLLMVSLPCDFKRKCLAGQRLHEDLHVTPQVNLSVASECLAQHRTRPSCVRITPSAFWHVSWTFLPLHVLRVEHLGDGNLIDLHGELATERGLDAMFQYTHPS